MLYQQGDVLIEATDQAISSNCVPKSDCHLAEGEATGHFHEAIGDGVCVLEMPGSDDLILSAPNGCSVVHQEHARIEIPGGVFRVRIVQEFDHFREEARAVID